MNCKDFQKIIYTLKENHLSEKEMTDFQIHLLICNDCKKLFDQMTEINNSLKQLADTTIESPINLSDSIIEQIENKKQTKNTKLFYLKNIKKRRIIKTMQYVITGIAASLILFFYYLEFNDLNSINQLEKQISEYSIQKPIEQIIN
jgi:hypothetical protein